MNIQQQLKKLREVSGDKAGTIAIFGGGISGLVAAYELAKLGHHSVIFEASPRIGGRIMTVHYDGQKGELGAMRIPQGHDHTLYYLQLLGLQLGKFVDQNGNAYYDVRDHVVRIADGSELADLFNLSDYERSLTANGLGGILAEIGKQLLQSVSPNDIQHLYSGDFADSSPYSRDLDATSFLDFVSQRVQSQGALELMSAVNAMRDLWHSSSTGVIREVVSKRHDGLHEVVRGMQSLTDGMYGLLQQDYASQVEIHLNTEVLTIDAGAESGVNFTTRTEAGVEQQNYEYAICTLPFTVLRRMKLNGVSSGKQAAIANYNYADSTKVTLNFKKRFWESQEQPIFGGASLTDGIILQSYYPSDHAWDYLQTTQATQTADVKTLPRFTPHDIDLSPHHQPPMPDPGPGVMLASYSWGKDARRLSTLPPEDRIDRVKEFIKRYHDPAEVERNFDGGATMAWHDHVWSAGAFARLAPADLQMYYLDAIKREGNLFFCGEHLSHEPGWIQGSLLSTLGTLQSLLTDHNIRNQTRAIVASATEPASSN